MWRFLERKLDNIRDKLFDPIPPDFHSVEADGAFEQCIQCHGSLYGAYIIEKHYQNGETIFEYALCQKCATDLRQDISKESIRSARKCIRQRQKIRQDLTKCAFCLLPRHELLNFSIMGEFSGDEMFLWRTPMLLCEDCLLVVQEVLSKQTRDRLDRFEEENFPGPPADVEPLETPKLVLV